MWAGVLRQPTFRWSRPRPPFAGAADGDDHPPGSPAPHEFARTQPDQVEVEHVEHRDDGHGRAALAAWLSGRMFDLMFVVVGIYRPIDSGPEPAGDAQSSRPSHPEGQRALLLMAPGRVKTDLGGAGAALEVGESVGALVETVDAQRGCPGLRYLDRFGAPIAW